MKNKPNYAKFIKKPAPLSMSIAELDAQSAPASRGTLEAEELPFAEVILTPRQHALLGEVYATADKAEASPSVGHAFADSLAEITARVEPAGSEKRPGASKFTHMIQSLQAKAVTEGAPPVAPMVVFVVLLIVYMSI